MECNISECTNKVLRQGICNAHYLRLRRHGSPLGGKFNNKISCNHVDSAGLIVDWKHPLYNCYVGMKSRCYDEKNIKYKIYGGRGIRVCKRWLGGCGFHNFIDDMGKRPKNYSLDRIDCDREYSPENCKWSSIHEQNANKRTNRKNVGVYEANDNRSLRWRTTLVINGKEMAGKSFKTETEALEYIMGVRRENNIYVG